MKTEEGALTLNAAVQRNQAPVKTTMSLNYHFTYRPEAAFLMKNSFNTHTKKGTGSGLFLDQTGKLVQIIYVIK